MQSMVAMLGWPEIIAILIIIAVLVGARHIGELLGGMRRGMHEFVKATREVEDQVARALETEADAGDGQGFHPYGFKFWLIVAFGVAAMCAAAVGLRELLQ